MDLSLENGNVVGKALVAEDVTKLGKILGSFDGKVFGDSVLVISLLVVPGLADGLALGLTDGVGLGNTRGVGDDDAESVSAVTPSPSIPSSGSSASILFNC